MAFVSASPSKSVAMKYQHPSVVNRRLAVHLLATVDASSVSPHQQTLREQRKATLLERGADRDGFQASVEAPAQKHVLMLSSTTSVAASTDAALPTAFARVLVGAALALSTVYTLLSSPTSTAISFGSRTGVIPTSADPESSSSSTSTTRSSSISTAATPTFPSLPILRSPEQFDAFVLASNRAGYLAVVLFHAPWCSASQRMEKELQRLSQLFTGRRIVFARVDCSIKQGVRPGQPLGQSSTYGFRLQRCDLTQLHRIHKTPTIRMYHNNSCVDEITGCRPVDFRQATSDLLFKYQL